MSLRQLLLTAIISSLVTALVLFSLFYFFREQLREGENLSNFSLSTESVKTEDDLVMMIEKVNPAVVSVVVTKDVPIYEQYYEEFNPWGWMGGGISIPRTRENGTEEREVGGGSGFIVSEEGLIVTNRHVVSDDEARYSVLMNDGKTYEVEVLARDDILDIAVLKNK